MIRKGIPPPLRCAVWLSNIVQSSRPDQELAVSHQYRTLAKVGVVDGLYDGLWEGTDGSGRIRREDVTRVDFGNGSIWAVLDGEGPCPGVASLERVLYALHRCVMGGSADYSPLLPALAAVLLGSMSEAYAFYSCREMYHASAWYFATSRMEHVATQRAFADILGRLHPQTYGTMVEQEAVRPYANAVFRDFFATILPGEMVRRLMDMYSLEGGKVLFRFGVALAVLYGKEYKERYMYTRTDPDKWWLGLVEYCHDASSGVGLNFEVWVKKAYGVHGRGRRFSRFPRRPILARIIEMEEEAYRAEQLERRAATAAEEYGGGTSLTDGRDDSYKETDLYLQVEPLGLVPPAPPADPDHEPVVAHLAAPTVVRTRLAEWLPLSLRFTKLELVYSSSHHGRTLERLYSHVSKSTHTVLILEPYERRAGGERLLIGMYASHVWHPSRRVYGDGRCFLFRIVLDEDGVPQSGGGDRPEEPNNRPDPPVSKCWKWHPPDLLDFASSRSEDRDSDTSSPSSSKYQQASSAALLETFQMGTADFLSMGGNDNGGAGLRLNEDLSKGESDIAAGFDNEPLLPNAGGMFEVGLVEVYQLVRQMDGVPIR